MLLFMGIFFYTAFKCGLYQKTLHFNYIRLLEMRVLLELRVLFEGGPYMRKYGIYILNICFFLLGILILRQTSTGFLCEFLQNSERKRGRQYNFDWHLQKYLKNWQRNEKWQELDSSEFLVNSDRNSERKNRWFHLLAYPFDFVHSVYQYPLQILLL